MKQKILTVIGILMSVFLFESCSSQRIAGIIRIVDEQGNSVSGVRYLQNTEAIVYNHGGAPRHHPKDQTKIRISSYKTDRKGYVGYSTELYQPSRSYLLFYKEGYYPSYVTLAGVRKHTSLVPVNSKSQCARIGNIYIVSTFALTGDHDSAELIQAFTEEFGNENKKNICAVAKQLEALHFQCEHMYAFGKKGDRV